MDPARDVRADTTQNPAAVADAEQHARQEIAAIRTRVRTRAAGALRPLAAVAGIVVSGWLIRRWRPRR
jgi:cell division septal protein FtsQ